MIYSRLYFLLDLSIIDENGKPFINGINDVEIYRSVKYIKPWVRLINLTNNKDIPFKYNLECPEKIILIHPRSEICCIKVNSDFGGHLIDNIRLNEPILFDNHRSLISAICYVQNLVSSRSVNKIYLNKEETISEVRKDIEDDLKLSTIDIFLEFEDKVTNLLKSTYETIINK